MVFSWARDLNSPYTNPIPAPTQPQHGGSGPPTMKPWRMELGPQGLLPFCDHITRVPPLPSSWLGLGRPEDMDTCPWAMPSLLRGPQRLSHLSSDTLSYQAQKRAHPLSAMPRHPLPNTPQQLLPLCVGQLESQALVTMSVPEANWFRRQLLCAPPPGLERAGGPMCECDPQWPSALAEPDQPAASPPHPGSPWDQHTNLSTDRAHISDSPSTP